MRRAKIVATFGPAIASFENTLAVLEAGVDVARMNMSHGDYSVHDTTYENVRKAAGQLSKPVAIMADLQGPKIRLGRFVDGPHLLAEGDIFTITTENVPGTKDICSTTLKSLTEDVNVGDALLIDDGKVALRAIEVDDVKVVTVVTVGGMVSNNKGINLPGVAVNVPALSEKDEDDLRWAIRRGVDMVALSFVRDATDIRRVHEIMDEEGRRVPVIAKIEKPQAVEQLHEIIDAFDAIMVARGDLGVELPLEEVPIVQKRAIELARRWAKPVIVTAPTPCLTVQTRSCSPVRPAWASTRSKPSRSWPGSSNPQKCTAWSASPRWAPSPRPAAAPSPVPPSKSPISWKQSTSVRSPSPVTPHAACRVFARSGRCSPSPRWSTCGTS
ncbi:MAG: hypothetical protein NVS3B6_16740 [Pseudarthrobacter sp.]